MSVDDEDTIAKKTRKFMGTITIIVIYATFILLMCLAGFFSTTAREYLFVKNITFTATFITGTIVIIVIMLIQLFARKPKNSTTIPTSTKYSGEALACPDFWVLKQTPQNELDAIDDLQIREMSKHYCENPLAAKPDPDTNFDPNEIQPLEVRPAENPKDEELHNIIDTYNSSGISSDYHMKCNRMYPDYMTHIDRTKFKENPTTIRCNYLKQCSISTGNHLPWTGIC